VLQLAGCAALRQQYSATFNFRRLAGSYCGRAGDKVNLIWALTADQMLLTENPLE